MRVSESLDRRCSSERRVAGSFVGTVDRDGPELVTVLLDQLQAVALPDGIAQVGDELEDREGLLGVQ